MDEVSGNSVQVAAAGASETRQNRIMQKKDRIDRMRSFLSYKHHIMNLLSQNRYEEAREAYNSLYLVYQEILVVSSDKERSDMQRELAVIYEKVSTSIQKEKLVKKSGDLGERQTTNQDDKHFQRRIITTDIDKLVELLDAKSKVSLSEIQTRFNVSKNLAEEWIQILADYGLADIRYLPVGGVEITKPVRKKQD